MHQSSLVSQVCDREPERLDKVGEVNICSFVQGSLMYRFKRYNDALNFYRIDVTFLNGR